MSTLIQALEKLEKQSTNYKEDLSFLLVRKKNQKNKSNLKVLVLTGISIAIAGFTAVGINLYESIYLNTNITNKVKETQKPAYTKAPHVINQQQIDIPVDIYTDYPVEKIKISQKEIKVALSDIDFRFPQEKEKPTPKKSDSKQIATQNNNSLFLSLVSLAEQSYSNGNLQESLKYYQQAYNIKKDEDILQNIIFLYIQTNQYQKALENISQIQSTDLLYEIILKLIENQQLKLAKQLLFRYIPYDTNGDFLYLAGYLYELNQDYQKALKFYRKAYFKNPKDQYFMYAYGRLLEINNETLQAQKIFNKLRNMPDLDNEIKEAISR